MRALNKPNMDGWVKLKCPFHFDKDPSASFNVHTGYFHCFGCDAGMPYKELKRKLGEDTPDRIGFGKVITRFGDALDWRMYYNNAHSDYHPYLKERKIEEDTALMLGIKHNSEGIIIPIADDFLKPRMLRKVEGIVVRRFKDFGGRYRYYFDGEQKPPFYPTKIPTQAKANGVVILTEGVFGALNLRSKRYNWLAFSTLGASIDERQMKLVTAMASNNEIVVAFDADNAGITGVLKLLTTSNNVKAILPGVEADEIGREGFNRMLSGASNLSETITYLNTHLQDY